MSRIKAVYQVQNPAEMEISLTITMKVADWERFYEQALKSSDTASFPLNEFVSSCRQLFLSAQQKFESEIEI